MSGEPEQPTPKPPKPTAAEKERQYVARVKRTIVASFMGIITGIVSFVVIPPAQSTGLTGYTILALLIMLLGVVAQRHVFHLGVDRTVLKKKDWFYQGFMTFAFWFISWTLLLTTSAP
jgi:hypothetical protein